MKKSIFFIASLVILMSISSCNKEVIEIVNEKEVATEVEMNTKSISKDDSDTDDYGSVTDPDEDADFDLDQRNTISQGQ